MFDQSIDFEHFTRELRERLMSGTTLYNYQQKKNFIKWENIVERENVKFKESIIRSVFLAGNFSVKISSMASWQIDIE